MIRDFTPELAAECAHEVTSPMADSLGVLDNEDWAAAGAAGLHQCEDCGAIVAPGEGQ